MEITRQLKAHAEGFYLINLWKTLANRIRERCLRISTLGFNFAASRLERKTFAGVGPPACVSVPFSPWVSAVVLTFVSSTFSLQVAPAFACAQQRADRCSGLQTFSSGDTDVRYGVITGSRA